jgi:hypothetical protein
MTAQNTAIMVTRGLVSAQNCEARLWCLLLTVCVVMRET